MLSGSTLRLLGISLLLLTAACKPESASNTAGNAAAADESPTNSVALSIRTASGKTHHFTVELAVDSQSQERGLMDRKSLPDDHGMLFPFPYPQAASFWMKNTPLPLDLVFIRPDGTIAAILQGKPNDLHPLSAGEGVSAVLEIAQGRAAALGIEGGDHVQWGDCSTAAPAANAWRADRFCPE